MRAEIPTQAGDDYASTYRFEAEVPSASGQRIANRAEIVMHPASIYVGLTRPKFFTDVTEGLSVSAVAVDLSGVARPGVAVTVSLLREQWTGERRPENPGSVIWVRKEIPAGEWTVTTAAAPVRVPATLKDGGCFILRAVAKDAEGRPTRTETRFYALGGGYSMWRTNGNRIDLTPERTVWKPGETARVLVQSPWSQATALVTKEREGIKTHQRIDITSTQDAVEIPITDADVPNVYVSVVLFKGRTEATSTPENPDPGKPAFRVGYVELTVDDASKRLQVEVKADREEYRPRQNVNVSVAVRDAAGRPRAGRGDALGRGLRPAVADELPGARRRARDLRAQVAAGANAGQPAAAHGQAIDRRRTAAPGAGFGGRGGGGGRVRSESALVSCRSAGSAAAGDGRHPDRPRVDGLAQSAQATPPSTSRADLRTDFRSLVFWLGSVTTGADGRTATTVTLPDSLTTFRIIAVAGDAAVSLRRGGHRDPLVQASHAARVVPAVPFRRRPGVLRRHRHQQHRTRWQMRWSRFAVSTRAVTVPAAATQTVRLAPGESRNVRFPATARGSGARAHPDGGDARRRDGRVRAAAAGDAAGAAGNCCSIWRYSRGRHGGCARARRSDARTAAA